MRAALLGAFGIGCGLAPVTQVCPERFVERSVHVQTDDRLDVLFVVDSSPSMDEERPVVAAELERMVRMLSTGDRDGDGVLDFTPLRSLHVGVVSSDLGADGCSPIGDDAVLRAGCGTDGRVFRFGFDPPVDEEALAAEVGCTLLAAPGGCALEQPLEAALRALSPASADGRVAPGYVPPRGATLHGDGANAGFLRPDSVLLVVIATDEDDCSLASEGAPAPDGDAPDGCVGRSLQPLQRYVDGLLQLRSSPGLVAFSLLGAVPSDLVETDASYEQMLADPRMAEVRDASGALAPSCESALGRGTPPRRLIELATLLRDRGAVTRVASVCAPSVGPLLDVFAYRGLVSPGLCLPERLETPADACQVELRLPAESEREANRRCAALGFELLGVEQGRERCEVPLVDPLDPLDPEVAGWTYSETEGCDADSSLLRLVGMDHLTDVDLTVRCALSIPEGGPPLPEECPP